MYLRRTTQRRKDGSVLTHFQIAESVWNPAKKRSEARVLYNCGRAEDPDVVDRLKRLAGSIQRRFSPEELAAANPGWRVLGAWDYGQIHVLEAIWRELGLREAIEEAVAGRRFGFSVERALFAMVANRICAPASKLYCWEQWLQEDVLIDGAAELELQHLYRAMDVVEQHREELQRVLFDRTANLLNLDVELIFYDTTSLHFEIDEADQAGDSDEGEALRRRGNSKNGRTDAPQVVVGLAVTREGFPIRHWVFPGNTVDVSTVDEVRKVLRDWRLHRCVFVGDAGMVSAANLALLARAGGRYIVNVPMRREKEVTDEVLRRPGRYRVVAQNLRVKEVLVGDGERRRRYVVCHNPQEKTRKEAHRAGVLRELEAELATLQELDGARHTKRVCALRSSRRYGRYLRQTKGGKLRLDKARIRAEEKLDGKFVVHTNDDSLTAEDVALGYKQLLRVEAAWRRLKSGLRMRPVYHHAPHRIRAHITLTVLALLLERVAEHRCGDTWRNIRDDLKQIKVVRLIGPDGELHQVAEPDTKARKRLKELKIQAPPLLLNVR